MSVFLFAYFMQLLLILLFFVCNPFLEEKPHGIKTEINHIPCLSKPGNHLLVEEEMEALRGGEDQRWTKESAFAQIGG